MKTGDRVTIIGKAGQVTAQVLDVRSTAELPDIPMIESEEARAILATEFQRVAIIGYHFGPERIPVMFVALEDARGAWCDLHGHALIIEAKKGENPCPAPSPANTPSR